jgi:hypothetical protein
MFGPGDHFFLLFRVQVDEVFAESGYADHDVPGIQEILPADKIHLHLGSAIVEGFPFLDYP